MVLNTGNSGTGTWLPKPCMSFTKDVSMSAGHSAMPHDVTRFIIVTDNWRSIVASHRCIFRMSHVPYRANNNSL